MRAGTNWMGLGSEEVVRMMKEVIHFWLYNSKNKAADASRPSFVSTNEGLECGYMALCAFYGRVLIHVSFDFGSDFTVFGVSAGRFLAASDRTPGVERDRD